MKIHELPDYAALKQLAAALRKVGKARGAAVFVGAGFSRNAERLNGITNVSITEDFFSFAKIDFLEVLVEVASNRGSVPGDAVAFCSLSELYVRRRKIRTSVLGAQLKRRFQEQPTRRISVVRARRNVGASDSTVKFTMSDVVGFCD